MLTGTEIELAPAEDLEPYFLSFFQSGIHLKGRTGVNVKKFLVEDVQIDLRYIEERIQTVFLDGRAVDDLEAAVVRQGSVLTLSAAMPGLLGATMRVGSIFAPMRSQVSHHSSMAAVKPGEGLVLLKLFNMLIRELAPGLLNRGVWISGARLGAFLKHQDELFWGKCEKAYLDGRLVKPETLVDEINWGEEALLFRLRDL